MSHHFQVLCLGTSCGNGNGCGATFSLSQKNADGLPKVRKIFAECGPVNEVSASSEATTTTATNTNQGRAGPNAITTELEHSAGGKIIGSNRHDVKYLSTAAVSGGTVLLILITITAYCICRRGRRNHSNTRVSKQISSSCFTLSRSCLNFRMLGKGQMDQRWK